MKCKSLEKWNKSLKKKIIWLKTEAKNRKCGKIWRLQYIKETLRKIKLVTYAALNISIFVEIFLIDRSFHVSTMYLFL